MANTLVIPLRNTQEVDFSALRPYIEQNGQHADLFKSDIATLDRSRDLATTKPTIAALMEYYSHLTALSSKASPQISFTWYNSLAYSSSAVAGDINFERANILYNIASIYSSTRDTPTIACRQFQLAAGILQCIKSISFDTPEELNKNTLDVLISLMLAQAQESAWQKAINDNLKPSVIARLASQVSAYYADALNASSKTSSLTDAWISHITCKHLHFSAAAQFRASEICLESGKYGEEIARLQTALDSVTKALSYSNISKPVRENIAGLHAKLKSHLARANRDNDLIYLNDVPTSLPPLKPASTVSPIAPEFPLSTLFAKLTPQAARVAIQIYNQRRDIITNNITSQLHSLTAQLHSTLSNLNLPAALQALERPIGLPPSLLTRAQEVNDLGGINALRGAIEDVRTLAHTDSQIFAQITNLPHDPEQIRAYDATITAARESDELVRSKFRQSEQILSILSNPDALSSFIPQSPSLSQALDSNSKLDTAVSQVRDALASLAKLESERESFLALLRNQAESDDVKDLVLELTNQFMSLHQDLQPELYESEFTKRLLQYNHAKERLEQEQQLQSELLTNLELSNIDFVALRPHSQREEAIVQVQRAYDLYHELRRHLSEGINFYNELAGALNVLLDECIQTKEQIEREENERKMRQREDREEREEKLVAPRPILPAVLNVYDANGNNVWTPDRGIRFE